MTKVEKKLYRHTQSARIAFAIFAVLALVWTIVAVVAIRENHIEIAVIMAFVLVVSFLVTRIFASLTVEVTPSRVRWFFGPGLWSHSIARDEIAEVAPVRTKWWYGWGIRYTPKGWLYNIWGLEAVAIRRKSGRVTLLGTDEPHKLTQAITD